MERIFSIIAAISVLMILLASGGSYWLLVAKVTNSEKTAISAIAKGLASGIALQLETLQQSVDGMARSPDVIAALNSGDPNIISNVELKLQTVMPGALKIRLLLPSINEPDQTSSPHMGFGDLEMVRSTLTDKQKPVIQGEGEHRHLALTSAVTQNERVIGVVLASLKADIINQAVAKTVFADGYAEIKQDQIVLAAVGNKADKNDDPELISLGDSRWTINVWPESNSSLVDASLIITIIAIPSMLSCLAFFVGYRKLAEFLHQDQGSILKAAKDMMTGKHVGNYPIQLNEMRPIISTLAQFRRVISQVNAQQPSTEENQEPDMFNESFDIDFLEDSTPVSTDYMDDEATLVGSPVTMPNIDYAKTLQPPAFVLNDTNILQPPAFVLNDTNILKETLKETSLHANIFRSYDIRGVIGKDLNEEIVADIGRAVASEARQLGIKLIVIARDGRLSSQSFSAALAKGICLGGCDVMDIGMVPTPMLYFVAHHSEGRSGIMVTGSHNPADYNGLKIVLNGETLANDRIQDIRLRIEAEDYSLDEPGIIEENSLFTNEYIGIISEDIRIARPMKVVVDCGNGVAGELGPILLKTLGCEVIELYCNIDGNFPNHHPDPSKPENMKDLAESVIKNAADVGIAFDGDGDRLGIVDSKGKIILPDRQMMVFARDVLARKPASKIIYDVKCSKNLHEEILKRGGQPIMWKTGHSLLKAKIKEIGAALAGELSGHIFFNDRWFGFDDALYASARMIQILSEDTRTSQEVFAELPESINTPEMNVALQEGENIQIIEKMFNLANFKDGKIIDIDGMRVEFADGWGLVRPSNTTPSLTLRFETDSQEAMSRIQAQFKSLLLQIKPDIILPF